MQTLTYKPPWNEPLFPRDGFAPECLLRDDCAAWDDPRMDGPLLPLDNFDDPQLRCPVDRRDEAESVAGLRRWLAKECAGLAHKYRPDAVGLMAAFHSGTFTEQNRVALEWAYSGMRVGYSFPRFIANSGLPIYEVVRCFWTLFDGDAFGTGPWLNQWAEEPSRPHPWVLAIKLDRDIRRRAEHLDDDIEPTTR